jgi:hypothetical protein
VSLKKLSYRTALTNHGGVILPGIPHNVYVEIEGNIMMQASVDKDPHLCPIHGMNHVNATGFAKFEGIKHTRVGDPCECGAEVVGESANSFSD